MKLLKRGLLSMFLASTLLLAGCDVALAELTLDDVLKELFKVHGDQEAEKKKLNEHVFSKLDNKKSLQMTRELDKRFSYKIKSYKPLVDKLWNTQGFYRMSSKSTEKEALIDFYLFMEYHKDTQKRNLQYPEFLQDDLMLVESMFMRRAINYIDRRKFNNEKYRVLRDDLVTLNRNLYREEVLNILYEGHQQVDLLVRMPNIIERSDEEMKNIGIRSRLKKVLGIPDSVVSRGMGVDMVTLYSTDHSIEDADTYRMALMLAMEMKLSGISLRLERFFHATNSIKGVSSELRQLRRDVKLLTDTGEFGWVRGRMLRSISHLEKVHSFYSGKGGKGSVNQIFVDLKTREDFYALRMLSDDLQSIMDKEDNWDDVESARKVLSKKRGKQ